jgi:hypothetical protein
MTGYSFLIFSRNFLAVEVAVPLKGVIIFTNEGNSKML